MNLPAGVKAARQSKAASYQHCHQEGGLPYSNDRIKETPLQGARCFVFWLIPHTVKLMGKINITS